MHRTTGLGWLSAIGCVAGGALASTASAQIGISTTTTAFTDISGTGTSVGAISDDSEFTVTGAALAAAGFTGNGLLAGGVAIRVGNNGGVIWGNAAADTFTNATDVGYINSTTLPTMAADNTGSNGNGGSGPRQFLSVLWDDNTPGTAVGFIGSTKWQVIGGDLYIQWTNEDHFNATGAGVVTYEMIVRSGVTIASQLPLVEFVYQDTLYSASQYQDDGGSATIGYKNWGLVGAANDVEFGTGGGNNTISDPAFGDATMKPKVAGYAAANNPLLPHALVIKGTPPAPPANDDCSGAFVLAATQSGDTTLANNSASSTCDATGKDVWYKYTNGSNAGTLTLDTCTSAIDAVIAVYNSCGGAEIACDDNSAACGGGAAQVALALTGGQSIVIRVSDKGTSGTFALHSNFVVPPPANDECSTATVIAGSGSFPADNRFATPATATAPGSVCQSSQSRDIWFRWTSTQPGAVNVDTCGASQPASDSVVTVYTGSCGSLTEIACDDDTCVTPGAGSQLTFTAACATTYYIRLSNWSTTVPASAWTLNIAAPAAVDSDGDTVIDCLDGCPNDGTKTSPGICGCGVADTDSDGDTVADCIDGCPNDGAKTSPGQCGCGVADTDSDGDTVADCIDGCPNDGAKTSPGICGCGVSDVDSDGDGFANCIDGCPNDAAKTSPGVCGCGVADTDSDGDGFANCVDGCPNDAGKQAPGQCGCGVADTDTDNDGVADCNDNCDLIANPGQQDCDGDGIGDVCEIAAGASDTNADGIPDSCQFGATYNYCTGGTSTHGCVATLSATGVPSASATSGFTITTSNLEGQKFGLMFYGVTGTVALPWGSGTSYLCVKSPTQRTPSTSTGGTTNLCDGSIAVDFLAYGAANPLAVGMPLFAGEVIDAQTWYRDPPASKTTNLSNGLQFTMMP